MITSQGVVTRTLCSGSGSGGGEVGSGGRSDELFSAGEMARESGSGGEARQRGTPVGFAVADFGLLTFARGEGTGEWDYPWDLTGGLYR